MLPITRRPGITLPITVKAGFTLPITAKAGDRQRGSHFGGDRQRESDSVRVTAGLWNGHDWRSLQAAGPTARHDRRTT